MYKYSISQKGISFEMEGVTLNYFKGYDQTSRTVFRKEEGNRLSKILRIFSVFVMAFAIYKANIIVLLATIFFAVSTAKKIEVIAKGKFALTRLTGGIIRWYDITGKVPLYREIKKENLFDEIFADYCIEILCVVSLMAPIVGLGVVVGMLILVPKWFKKPTAQQYVFVTRAFSEMLNEQDKITGKEAEILKQCCEI